MKIVPLSYELCKELLNMGYNQFVIKYDQANEMYSERRIVTYEAVRSSLHTMCGDIEQMMYLPVNEIVQYYVMFKDLSKTNTNQGRSLVGYEELAMAS